MPTTTRRAYTLDAPIPFVSTARHARDAAGPALKTKICEFAGTGFTAEREGDSLVVYLNTAEPFATNAVGDTRKQPMTIAELQKRHEAIRRERWGSK